MRRKKDDKRVLRAGNGRNTRNSRKNNKRSFGFSNNRPQAPHSRPQKQKTRSGKTVFIMILILLAVVIGAGAGVMLSFDNGSGDVENETHIENVTVEMTTNLNQTPEITFDEADAVDYNGNQTSLILGRENNNANPPSEDIQH